MKIVHIPDRVRDRLSIRPFVDSFLLLLVACCFAVEPLQAQSLYADPKAHRQGDVVTIVLAERTAAQRESGYQNSSNATMGGSATTEGGEDLSGKFSLDASFGKSARNRNETVQSDLLTGTITARIVDVDSTGHLVIKGERKLHVNGITHLMRVSGSVRPLDIQHNNTVLSYQIADAFIEYRRDGMRHKFFKPGALVRVGVVAVLAGALLYASQ